MGMATLPNIRAYPKTIMLNDGAPVVLRPLEPGDKVRFKGDGMGGLLGVSGHRAAMNQGYKSPTVTMPIYRLSYKSSKLSRLA